MTKPNSTTELFEKIVDMYDQSPPVVNPYPGGTAESASFGQGAHSGWDAAVREVIRLLQHPIPGLEPPEIDESETVHEIVLYHGSHEWDRARVYNGSYTLEAARRQIEEWKEKILREEPDANLMSVEIR